MFQSCFDCYLQMLHFFIKMQATITMMYQLRKRWKVKYLINKYIINCKQIYYSDFKPKLNEQNPKVKGP